MAEQESKTGQRFSVRSEIPEGRIEVRDNERLQIEFRIDDLVRKLVPGGSVATSCSGCHGCSGCSM